MLTDAKVRNIKPQAKRFKIADGNGLYLDVRPNGNKSWVMRTEREGKRTWIGIGGYPLFSLDDARARVLEIKRGEAGLAPEYKKMITFRAVAEEYVPKLEATASQHTVSNVYGRLERHVYPLIGDRDISSLTTKDMYAVIERMEKLGIHPTAAKTLQTCSAIFRHAILKEYCEHDPCYALRGMVKRRPTEHRASLSDADDIGLLMRRIQAYDRPIPRLAMMFSAYTFCRPGEITRAEWSEIDIDDKIWMIPAAKMKMKRDHMVPLTRQMIGVLNEMRPISGHRKYIFSCIIGDNDRPMAHNTVSVAIRSLGYAPNEMTAHGFRGMASTVLNENGFNRDWIEMQLAHAPRDQVRSAYNRAQYWDGRCEMVQWYNDFLDELRDKK